ncbi:MAG: Asp-tRNA(Asn)/Glu-tRNA(Gln) amidotransferase subunit GatB [Desulfurococcales archaeon]|nr:Asp-tRNA(Asn)/Glu-tRNA(Gln) amidotransferase subunit GatB [Desulfurococcales archaeon]
MKAKIGLEVHVQLTEAGSKLFCSCKSNYRGLPPNSNVCPVCLGLPGALPVPSRRAVVLALAAARILNCRIPGAIVFTRKHYFYPDLPKNYQITQYERAGGAPVCMGGSFEYLDPESWEWHRVRIRRVNLEEDPGRSVYPEGSIVSSPYVLVDYNRSGVPLLEIVTEPDIPSPRAARAFVEYLLLNLEYIGATNPRLEGAFRVDANISVEGGERVEVKNIGSTHEVERALQYEYRRQSLIIERGGTVNRETRHWDAARRLTKPLRHKEEEEEYLYMPDPDLPMILTKPLLGEAEDLLTELPRSLLESMVSMGVPREVAWSIIQVKHAANIFKAAAGREGVDPVVLARLIGVDYKGALKDLQRDPYDPGNWPGPETFSEIVLLVARGEYPLKAVTGLVVPRLAANPRARLEEVLPEKAGNLEEIVEEVIESFPKAVNDYRSGRGKALDFLVGQVIRRVGKRAVDPRLIREMIMDKLNNEPG